MCFIYQLWSNCDLVKKKSREGGSELQTNTQINRQFGGGWPLEAATVFAFTFYYLKRSSLVRFIFISIVSATKVACIAGQHLHAEWKSFSTVICGWRAAQCLRQPLLAPFSDKSTRHTVTSRCFMWVLLLQWLRIFCNISNENSAAHLCGGGPWLWSVSSITNFVVDIQQEEEDYTKSSNDNDHHLAV